MYESHQYSMLGKGLLRMKIGGEMTDRITTNNERNPWDDSDDDEDTEISRVSQTPNFDLSSTMSLLTDSGPLAFPQVPHKIQFNSTLRHPSSWLFNRNLILNVIVPHPPTILVFTPQPVTARPDVVDPIESSQPTVVDKHLSVLSPFSAALLPNMPDIRHLVRRTRSECRYRNNNHIFCE